MFHKTSNLVILSLVVAVILVGANFVYAYHDPANNNYHEPFGAPPGNNAPAPLNVSNIGQSKIGGLTLNTGGAANGLLIPLGNVGIGDTTPDAGTGGQLKVDVEGNVGATKYCDQAGSNCYTTTEMAGGGTGGTDEKVKSSSTDTTAGYLFAELVAGSGITITETGTGDKKVTIASTGGSGGGGNPPGFATVALGSYSSGNYSRVNTLNLGRTLKEGITITQTNSGLTAQARISNGQLQTRATKSGACDSGWVNSYWAACYEYAGNTGGECATATYQGVLSTGAISNVNHCPPQQGDSVPVGFPQIKNWELWD